MTGDELIHMRSFALIDMQKVYETASPAILLLSGWVLLALAMALRVWRDFGIPPLNAILILLGLAAYFLPVRIVEVEKGEALRRKLLWLLVLAGFLILAGELWRLLGLPSLKWIL